MQEPADDEQPPPSLARQDPSAATPPDRAWLRRFRDHTDLKSGLASAAVAAMSMELVNAAFGPLPPVLIGAGGLAIAGVALFGIMPRLRRGRW